MELNGIFSSFLLENKLCYLRLNCWFCLGLTIKLFTIYFILFIVIDKSKSRTDSNSRKETSIPKEGSAGNIAAQTFTFRELAAATKNFRQDCLLGEGGFGRVYKGRLENGQVSIILM